MVSLDGRYYVLVQLLMKLSPCGFWNRASIHMKRKDILKVQMSKMWKEMNFVRENG